MIAFQVIIWIHQQENALSIQFNVVKTKYTAQMTINVFVLLAIFSILKEIVYQCVIIL